MMNYRKITDKKDACTDAKSLLEQYIYFYNQRDMGALLNLFHDLAHLWGTGLDENLHTREEIKGQIARDWAQSEKNEIKQTSPLRSSGEQSSWCSGTFACDAVINGTEHIFKNGRITLVGGKDKQGIWKIQHMHCSFPASLQEEGESFPGHKSKPKNIPIL